MGQALKLGPYPVDLAGQVCGIARVVDDVVGTLQALLPGRLGGHSCPHILLGHPPVGGQAFEAASGETSTTMTASRSSRPLWNSLSRGMSMTTISAVPW